MVGANAAGGRIENDGLELGISFNKPWILMVFQSMLFTAVVILKLHWILNLI